MTYRGATHRTHRHHRSPLVEIGGDGGFLFPNGGLHRSVNTRDSDWESWKSHPARAAIIAWLEMRGIGWNPCAPMEVEYCLPAYRGEIFIDIPYDPKSPRYRELEDFLEDNHGATRFAGASLYFLTLQAAVQNAFEVDPNWIDDF